jgi:hypothetical protein
VFGTAGISRNKRQIDVGLLHAGQFDLAFSAAFFESLQAILSWLRSIPWSFLNSDSSQSIILWSKSSPPR